MEGFERGLKLFVSSFADFKIKSKNVRTGAVLELSFIGGDKVEILIEEQNSEAGNKRYCEKKTSMSLFLSLFNKYSRKVRDNRCEHDKSHKLCIPAGIEIVTEYKKWDISVFCGNKEVEQKYHGEEEQKCR